MSRKCSHCGHHGHNSRTCPDRGARFLASGLHPEASNIRKVSSMSDIPDQRQHCESGDERDHVAMDATVTPGPDKAPQNMETEGYNSDSIVHQSNTTRERKKGVPWTEDEHRLFLIGLQKLGKGDWRGISRHFVQTRTPTQVASHAQKYFIRQSNLNKRKRRSSLFDIVTEGPVPSAPMNRSGSSASLHYMSSDDKASPTPATEANASSAAPVPAAAYPFAYPGMPEAASSAQQAAAQAMPMHQQMYEAMLAARRAYNISDESPPSTSGFGAPGAMPFIDPRFAAAFDMAAAAGGAAGMVLPWGMVPGFMGQQPVASAGAPAGPAGEKEAEAPAAGAASFANGKLHRPKPSIPKPAAGAPTPTRPTSADAPPSPLEAALAAPSPVKAEDAAPTPTPASPENSPQSSGEEKSAVTGAAVDDDGEAEPVSSMSPGAQCAPLQPPPLPSSERHSAFHTSKLAAAC